MMYCVLDENNNIQKIVYPNQKNIQLNDGRTIFNFTKVDPQTLCDKYNIRIYNDSINMDPFEFKYEKTNQIDINGYVCYARYNVIELTVEEKNQKINEYKNQIIDNVSNMIKNMCESKYPLSQQ